MDPSASSSPDNEAADTSRTTPFSFLLEREERFAPLLLEKAHTAVLVSSSRSNIPGSWLEWIAIGAGTLAVVVGAWSALSFSASFVSRSMQNTPVAGAMLVAGPTFAAPSLAQSVPLSGTDLASTTATNGILPAHISIPAIGVDAPVEQVGKNATGDMGAPTDYKTVAWYLLGSRPGAPGSAVMAGHLNNSLSTSGVFANLDKLKRGDTITVTDDAGHTRTFMVVASEVYAADNAPNDLIFTTLGPSQLALITCDGAWNKGKKSFDQRLVVFARLVSSSS